MTHGVKVQRPDRLLILSKLKVGEIKVGARIAGPDYNTP